MRDLRKVYYTRARRGLAILPSAADLFVKRPPALMGLDCGLFIECLRGVTLCFTVYGGDGLCRLLCSLRFLMRFSLRYRAFLGWCTEWEFHAGIFQILHWERIYSCFSVSVKCENIRGYLWTIFFEEVQKTKPRTCFI